MKKIKKNLGKRKLMMSAEKVRDLQADKLDDVGGGLATLSATCCVAGTCYTGTKIPQ